MGLLANLFKKEQPVQTKTFTTFKELGTYRATFGAFGKDVYKSDDVRTCIRALAEHTSKANPRCTVKRIERLLQLRPNQYMNGKDFLAKVRNYLEIKNTAFVYINRDNKGDVIEFYPIPYSKFEGL